MKYLSYIAGIIAVVVIVQEFSYLGQSSLATVIIGLSIAVLLNSISIIKRG